MQSFNKKVTLVSVLCNVQQTVRIPKALKFIIIIIIMIYCPKWKIRNGKSFLEILFAQLIVGPAATEQRQVDVALSLSNVERQTG